MSEKKRLVHEILRDVKSEYSDRELMQMLIDKKVSANTDKTCKAHYTVGQRAADGLARFAGSWTFVFLFIGMMVIWMVVNVVILATGAFDPYPFILLNLVLSCIAAIQAPLIMMSQNRQEEKDRERAENDYKVNLKNELIIEDLYEKVERIIKNQEKLLAAQGAAEPKPAEPAAQQKTPQ